MSNEKLKLYEKIEFLGEGQFATVYKARHIHTNNIVAVKKIKIGTKIEAADGINRTALREIKLLQELNHENIIGLLDVYGHRSNVSLVFDFMETDLEIIIKDSGIILSLSHIKCFILQTFLGLEYLHNHWILHRDMKPNNLLLNNEGVLKIADFGLAKFYGSPNRLYTHQVVTRWYRAPELFYGARHYGTGIDVWAVGCILAELLLRKPFLPGESDLAQLSQIFSILGTPTEESWPGVTLLPDYIEFKYCAPIAFNTVFTAASEDLIHLLAKCLVLNPLQRCTSQTALQLPYFSNLPAPTPRDQLPRPFTYQDSKTDDPVERRSLKRKQPPIYGSLVKKLTF